MDEARRAEALARERERAQDAIPRPLWMTVLGFLAATLAVLRGGMAAVAFGAGLPAPVWLALALASAVAFVLGVALWLGSRASIGAAIALGIASVLGGVAQIVALGAPAAPAAVARALVDVLFAGALAYGLRRHFVAVGR